LAGKAQTFKRITPLVAPPPKKKEMCVQQNTIVNKEYFFYLLCVHFCFSPSNASFCIQHYQPWLPTPKEYYLLKLGMSLLTQLVGG